MISEDLQNNPKYVVDGVDSARVNRHYRTTNCRLCESPDKCYLFEDETVKIYICKSCHNWLTRKIENRNKIEEIKDY